jgi:hypothetical protein
MPFIGVMSCVLDTDNEALLGKPTPANGGQAISWSTIFRSVRALLLGLLFRHHRPNVFFNDRGHPVALPEVLASPLREK